MSKMVITLVFIFDYCIDNDRVIQRNEERKNKASASRQLEKAGYVPRSKQASESGLSSGGMMKRGKVAKDQELDEESAAGHKKTTENEAEINAGIAIIDRTLDNLNSLAGAMKTEVKAKSALRLSYSLTFVVRF